MKPDGVQRWLVGDVTWYFERRGFKLVGMEMFQAPESALAEHYHDLRRAFYPALISYMSSAPWWPWHGLVEGVEGPGLSPELLSPWRSPLLTFIPVLQVWEGSHVVCTSRAMTGRMDSVRLPPHHSRRLQLPQQQLLLWPAGEQQLFPGPQCMQKPVPYLWDLPPVTGPEGNNPHQRLCGGAQRESRLWFQSNELVDWAAHIHPEPTTPSIERSPPCALLSAPGPSLLTPALGQKG
ncbi:Nucleoside diphosphate kinase, mitochondrial [Myotis davidii]|uniref:nucleoside-diphosphate kinase n=1 Tax=Myotis davidii TaxID=225400 RepID=L5MIV3_MYODS|nr:Nucleoside diphosphate kinase, mitochondrial [Myotis davidii]